MDHLIDKPLDHLRGLLAHRPSDHDYLQRVGGELKAGVEALLTRTVPEYGFCHGDHHGYNVHQDEQGRMVVYDFDCWGYGWRAYDICVFLWNKQFAGWDRAARARTERRWKAFLEGYEAVRPLSKGERATTRWCVPIRHIWLLWLQTQGSERWGGGFVNDGYFDRHIDYIRQAIKHYRLL